MFLSAPASKWFMACAAVATVVSSASVASATVTPELGFELILDFNSGGDELLTLEFADGSDQSITGGQGVIAALSGGAIFFDDQPHNLETLLNIGLKFSTMQPTENADLSFLRLPIELLAFYRNDDLFFRVGGGPVVVPYNSLTGSGALEDIDVQFETALGLIGQVDFIFGGFALGVRYTRLSLTVDGFEQSIAAHTFGVNISGHQQFL